MHAQKFTRTNQSVLSWTLQDARQAWSYSNICRERYLLDTLIFEQSGRGLHTHNRYDLELGTPELTQLPASQLVSSHPRRRRDLQVQPLRFPCPHSRQQHLQQRCCTPAPIPAHTLLVPLALSRARRSAWRQRSLNARNTSPHCQGRHVETQGVRLLACVICTRSMARRVQQDALQQRRREDGCCGR